MVASHPQHGAESFDRKVCALSMVQAEPEDSSVSERTCGSSSEAWWERVNRSLPVHGIVRKRMKRIVQAGVSQNVSRFLHGHCFGVKPTPGGRLVLLLRLAPPSVTVSICDGPSVNAELRPWESDPLARLRQV